MLITRVVNLALNGGAGDFESAFDSPIMYLTNWVTKNDIALEEWGCGNFLDLYLLLVDAALDPAFSIFAIDNWF